MSPQGEHILRLDVWVTEEGQVSIKADTEREPAEISALLEIVAERMNPKLDRAAETEAWGARRRKTR